MTSTRLRSATRTRSPTSPRRRFRSMRRGAIINRLRERFPAIVGPRTDDICYATTNRQAAVKQLARESDLVLVIGSRNSSNSNRLVEVAREHGADSYLIDNESQVRRRVARGQARRRDHLRRQRAGGARSAPGRVLPLARNDRRAGARGRPGGRPLHAPQGDPPGDGGRRRLSGRCGRSSYSDLHLGARTERDVLRRDAGARTAARSLAGVRSAGAARRRDRVAPRPDAGRARCGRAGAGGDRRGARR